MSYIHEALKKAQIEREVRSPRYEGVIAAPGKRFVSTWKRIALWGLPLCLIILLAALTFSRLYFKEEPPHRPEREIREGGDRGTQGREKIG